MYNILNYMCNTGVHPTGITCVEQVYYTCICNMLLVITCISTRNTPKVQIYGNVGLCSY